MLNKMSNNCLQLSTHISPYNYLTAVETCKLYRPSSNFNTRGAATSAWNILAAMSTKKSVSVLHFITDAQLGNMDTITIWNMAYSPNQVSDNYNNILCAMT